MNDFKASNNKTEPMELKSILSNRLKEMEWTLTKLAKESGVPVSTLHTWISGEKNSLNLKQLRKVASILKMSVHKLAFGCEDPNHKINDSKFKPIFNGEVRITIHEIIK